MKVIKVIFCSLCLGIGVIILSFISFNYNPQTTLSGVVISKEKPNVSVKTIMEGNYQQQYGDWFGENFPFRSFLVKGYNQILFQTKSMVNDIQPGKGGNLHGAMWLKGYVDYEIDIAVLKQYREDIALIYDYLSDKGVRMFYMISPNKAELYAETIPWNYQLANKYISNPGCGKKQIINMLEELKIPYVDTLSIMQKAIDEEKIQPFAKTGIHWNKYGSISAMESYIDLLNQAGMDIPEIQKTVTFSKEPDSMEDIDYKSITNVYFSPFDSIYPHVNFTITDPSKIEKSVYAISTSYQNSFLELFKANDMPFTHYKRLYYNQLQSYLTRSKGGVEGELWQKATPFDKIDYSEIERYDIFVVEHNAGELPEAHIDFAHRFAEHLRLKIK
ncbi:MAG: alginate O-acetyltransferase AlgX-related protein [Filifactoraceae bacterium]